MYNGHKYTKEATALVLNEDKKTEFVNSLENGRSVHAYIVEGAEGSGKEDFAKFCAAVLVCTGENKPCGKCLSCKKIAGGGHPDIAVIEPPKDRKTISVDEVRRLRRDTAVLPNEGGRKVYIIKKGELLTDQVQNAMLKMIEEPPSFVTFFILTSKREALLATIRSRCQTVRLNAMNERDILEHLKTEYPKLDVETLESAASRCGGRIGRAVELLGKENMEMHDVVLKLLDALIFPTGSRFELDTYLLGLKYKRETYCALFDEALLALRDLLLQKCGSRIERLFFEPEEMKKYVRLCSKESLVRFIRTVEDVRDKIDKNVNLNAALTHLTLELWNAK